MGAAPAAEVPAVAPVVELEQVLATQRDLGRGRLRRWLTGKADSWLFRRPYGAAWDGEDLLVTDPGTGLLIRIDRERRVATSAPGLLESPVGVAACSPGVLVTDSRLGKVALLDDELELRSWLVEDLARPTGVACDGQRIFVAETARHRILQLTPQANSGSTANESRQSAQRVAPGYRLRVLGRRGEADGEFNYPTALAVHSGALWVGDTLNFRLQAIDPETGKPLASFGSLGDAPGEMPRLKGLAIDSGRQIWVSDAHLDQIGLFTFDGTFLASLGSRGAAPGEFSFPAGIAARGDGRVAVVDSLNRRVQIFRLRSERVVESGTRR